MHSRSRPQTDSVFPAAPKRSHLILMVAFFFLVGCVSIPFLSQGVWLWALAGIGLVLAVLLRRLRMPVMAGVAILCFALGAMHAQAAYHVSMPEEGTYEISGWVRGEVLPRSDNRIAFALVGVTLNDEPVSGTAYCTMHYEEEPPQLFDGAQVFFSGRVYHPGEKTGKPHLNFKLWMRQNGYRFGIAAYLEPFIANDPASAPVMDAAYRVRTLLESALERSMGQNSRIASALLFGQRDGLSDEERLRFQQLGIAHIMSVSGLHVGLVGYFVLRLMERVGLKRRTQLIILCVVLSGYCALTDFSPAAIRASIMLAFACVGRLIHRRGDPITTLSAAMLVVLIIDPLSALSAGFVLSFSATAAILLYNRPLEEVLNRLWPEPAVNVMRRSPRALWVKVQREIKNCLNVSICAQLGVLLPTMAYFNQLPLYGVLINLLIVPFVSAVLVPAYLITLMVSILPFISTAAGWRSSALTDVLLWLMEQLSHLPHASIRSASPPLILCAGLMAAGVMISRRVPGSLRRRALAAALTAAVAVFGCWLQRPDDLRYIQLSVGQADSALLLDGDTTVLIDADADASAALDYLMAENRDIDALILTHLHLDHAGGVNALLDSGVEIRHVYLPVNAHLQALDEESLAIYARLLAADIPVTMLASGDELIYNRSMIRVLWPESETVRSGHDANDYPLMLAIDLDGYTLLQASDLTGLYERYAAAPADVLKVAHHGSSASSYDDFLSFVSPRYALLSVSGGSRSLPGADTLNRLNSHGVTYFRTDECGDITLTVRKGQLIITPYTERTSR